jgi:hypothetical protein
VSAPVKVRLLQYLGILFDLSARRIAAVVKVTTRMSVHHGE